MLNPYMWRLTFDMSGGAKGAKRPLGRPLDGVVRRHAAYAGKTFPRCQAQQRDHQGP